MADVNIVAADTLTLAVPEALSLFGMLERSDSLALAVSEDSPWDAAFSFTFGPAGTAVAVVHARSDALALGLVEGSSYVPSPMRSLRIG